MKIKKEDYRCMHGYDHDRVFESVVEPSDGQIKARIYMPRVTIFTHGSPMVTKHTQLQKNFGKISREASEVANKWCEKWLALIHKYCTHKENEYKKNGYGMSIDISQYGYCYYSIVKFSEKELKIDLYPAVTAYVYTRVKTYLGFININQELNEDVLKKCREDALKEWELITGTN